MWHTTSTPSAISPAATKPHSCETRRMAATKRSTGPPAGLAARLLDRERLVDQLLAVRDFLGELRVRAFTRDLEPLVVFGRRKRHDLDLVLAERLHHLVVQAFRFLGEVGLRFLPRLEQRVLLRLGEAREGLLR